MIGKAEWIWMPHAGHLMVGHDCRFHLSTYVGGYVVSTVGEYFPDSIVREIIATSRNVQLKGKGDARRADYMAKIGFEPVGCDRLYETMVFNAVENDSGCCPWRQEGGVDIDTCGYNDPGEAEKGHMQLCEKWAAKEAT